MKTSLWIVIAVVAANVGFLVGYSVSSYTGFRNVDQAARETDAAAPAYGSPAAPAYGAPAPARAAPAPGYGAQ